MIIIDLASSYALLLWHMLWPITFGLALSALVRSYIPADTIVRRLGRNHLESASLSVTLGAVSSVCNYATIGMGHTLREKGASWSNTLAYMISSTNIGISMLVAIYGFLGILFLEILVVTAFGFITLAYLIAIVMKMPEPAAKVSASIGESGHGNPWEKACSFFRDDLNMTRKDILVGLLVASSVSVLMPSSWWQLLFWNAREHGFLAWLWNGVVGIIIAILTFGCSIGNVSLAAVMWWNGVSPGGVMAFLLSSLLTFPMLRMSSQYYGLPVTIRQATVLFSSILLSCLLMDYILDSASIYLVRSNTIAAKSGDGAIITLILNLVTGGLGLLMYWQGKGEDGCST
ncbi:permease [Endozoicomonas sp. ONNA2]|uniref:permease n=1 Tax=Endozoicomonas sp. ONNA2 TaxID=2828741 RepID=UPI002147705C|nr:permease [Endozoicomonas sp. ONNA2]